MGQTFSKNTFDPQTFGQKTLGQNIILIVELLCESSIMTK